MIGKASGATGDTNTILAPLARSLAPRAVIVVGATGIAAARRTHIGRGRDGCAAAWSYAA